MSTRTKQARRRPTVKPIEQHRDWLQLVDTEGPFLSVPVVKAEWPNGMDRLAAGSPRHVKFVDNFNDWRAKPEAQYETWIKWVLVDTAEWGEYLVSGTDLPGRLAVEVPEHHTTVRPWGALFAPDADVNTDLPAALVFTAPPGTPLRAPSDTAWVASTIDRAAYALRATGVAVAVVTDGRWWALVSADATKSTASGIVDATLWREEDLLRDAFLSLINARRLIVGPDEQRLPALFEQSLLQQEEVTEALGTQVRRAVELLVQAMSEAKVEAWRAGRPDPLEGPPSDAYEITVTVMMRIVFLLFAEERGMLPLDRDLYRSSYAISPLLGELDTRARDGEEDLANSSLAWYRLLATSTAIYEGASFEDLRMPAYGGSLFDPSRFPALNARNDDGSLRLPINDRVMLHVLRAVQTERSTGQLRRISFREIDVEQIGYIYEGLLGYTTKIAETTVLGLKGKEGVEPEITLEKLRSLIDETSAEDFPAALIAFLKEDQPGAKPPSAARLKSARATVVDEAEARRLLLPVCHHDPDLIAELLPLFGLLRTDLRGLPLVVPPGGLLVVETPSRKNAGAHYTPRSLAEEVVKYSLQPLVYSPGPLQTGDEAEWKPVSSAEILDLNVADIAAGSGAFLVAAARYLGEKLVASWTREGSIDIESLDDGSAARIRTSAEREVIAHCLYGADINPLAVEMCKLSLWLVSMDPTKPFSFVDDKVLCGNSLLGLTSADQLSCLHIDPSGVKNRQLVFARDIDGPLQEAAQLRESISQTTVDDDDPQRSAAYKAALLRQARHTTSMVRDVADGVVAAGLSLSGKPGRDLDEAYERLSIAVLNAHPEGGEQPNGSMLAAIQSAGLTPTVETDFKRWQPLHWILEVPEVLARGGFDAIVGNPPFLSGRKIGQANGQNVEAWLKSDLPGIKGSADLSAHFLRRGWGLLRRGGTLGLIATERITDGETAKLSTGVIVDSGRIYRANSKLAWPGKAATSVAIVWAVNTDASLSGRCWLDGESVNEIGPGLGSSLEPAVDTARTLPLPFLAGRGVTLLGDGFVIERDNVLLEELNQTELEMIRPFINGQDIMRNESGRRVAIDADKVRTEEELFSECPKIGHHLLQTVEPVRAKVTSQIHETRYWSFWDKRVSLFRVARSLPRFIVVAELTRTPVFVFTDVINGVYSDNVIIIASADVGILGVLSSSVYGAWFEVTKTDRGTGSRFVIGRCLRTFPFPELSQNTDVEAASISFANFRDRANRVFDAPGQLYRALDDVDCTEPTILDLRGAQVKLDSAVCAAYGWNDMELQHGFHSYGSIRRFTIDRKQRQELRARLLDRNSQLG